MRNEQEKSKLSLKAISDLQLQTYFTMQYSIGITVFKTDNYNLQ